MIAPPKHQGDGDNLSNSPIADIESYAHTVSGRTLRARELNAREVKLNTDLDGLERIFGRDVSSALKRDLARDGIPASRVLVTGNKFGISDSGRINLRLDFYDFATQTIQKSFFLVTPHNDDEIQDTIMMAEDGHATRVVKAKDGSALKTNGGDIIIPVLNPKDRLDNLVSQITSFEDATRFGEAMARFAQHSMTAGILYDFEGNRGVGGVGITRKTKGRDVQRHCILPDFASSGDVEVVMLDWSGSKRVLDFRRDEKKKAYADFVKDVIRLIHSSTTPGVGERALFAFTSYFGGSQKQGIEYIMNLFDRTGEIPASEIFSEAWDGLCGGGNPNADQRHWRLVRKYMTKSQESLVPTPTKLDTRQEIFVDQIVTSSNGVVDRDSAISVVKHFTPQVASLDMVSTFHYDSKHDSISIYSVGAKRRKFAEYHVLTGLTDSEFVFCLHASSNGKIEPLVAVDDERNQVISARHGLVDLRKCLKALNVQQSVALAGDMARLFNEMVYDGILSRPMDYEKNGVVKVIDDNTALFHFKYLEPSSTTKFTELSVNPQKDVDKHLEAIARLIQGSMVYGHQAWKAFEGSVLANAPSETVRDMVSSMMAEVKERLSKKREFALFFENSETSLHEKKDLRTTQRRITRFLRSQEAEYSFHPGVFTSLVKKAPQIAQVVQSLTGTNRIQDVGGNSIPLLLEDVLVDISQVHVALAGDHKNLAGQAVDGSLSLKRGYYLVKPFSMERRDPRFSDWIGKTIAVEFTEGGIGKPFVMAESEVSKLFCPTAFTADITDGKKYSAGNPKKISLGLQTFSVGWYHQFFKNEVQSQSDTTILLNHMHESSRSWLLQNIVLSNYSKEVANRIFSLIEQDSQRFDPAERKDYFSRLHYLLDPSNPDFFDQRFAHVKCKVYEKLPELLDVKVTASYPHLAERLSDLFTLEDASEHVARAEKKTGARLSEADQKDLLARLEQAGEIKRVEVSGRPSEYIKDIVYMQDMTHYVVAVTVQTNTGIRRAVIKRTEPKAKGEMHTNLVSEIVPSSIVMNIRNPQQPIFTPMIIAFDAEYGVESLMTGQQLDELDPNVVSTHSRKLARALGTLARVSNLIGDGHSRNILLSDEGDIVRLDMERPKRWEDDPAKTLEYNIFVFELNNLTDKIPGWNSSRDELFGDFVRGFLEADARMKDGRVQRNIMRLVQRISTSYSEDRSRLSPKYIKNIRDSFTENPNSILKELATHRRDEYKQIYQDHSGATSSMISWDKREERARARRLDGYLDELIFWSAISDEIGKNGLRKWMT
ncbi:MAG TPA: hypothetical protein ENN13_02335 [Candidatus Altiarchaeales archaeon]|nr:hypothetical protein [Candidatus Altiarchaeales archaeon]